MPFDPIFMEANLSRPIKVDDKGYHIHIMIQTGPIMKQLILSKILTVGMV